MPGSSGPSGAAAPVPRGAPSQPYEAGATLRVVVRGVGVVLPGLPDWAQARGALAAGTVAAAPLRMPELPMLPAAERRRAQPVVRLALGCAHQAVADSGLDPHGLASVFASSDGDSDNSHRICEALAEPEPMLSPTRFHNSVQNAVSGYWSIATGSREATTSVLGGDAVFAEGLLEAVLQSALGRRPVLLVVYDLPMPVPLHIARPIAEGGAVALVLDAVDHAEDRLPVLGLTMLPAGQRVPADDVSATVASAGPAALALPLLQALAARHATDRVLAIDAYNALRVTLTAGRAGPVAGDVSP